MSLGGLVIAIGILVDAAVVVVENIQVHLSSGLKGRDKLHIVYRATLEVAQPVISGTIIIYHGFSPLIQSVRTRREDVYTPGSHHILCPDRVIDPVSDSNPCCCQFSYERRQQRR